MVKFLKWSEVKYNWSNVNLTWKQINIYVNDIVPNIIDVLGNNYIYDIKKINKLPNDKKKEIIKMVCSIEGNEYIIYNNKKNITITIKDIDIIVNEILNKAIIYVQNIS